MQEIDTLIAAIEYALTPKTLLNKKVLITAGPTHEAIDPVRYISNASTGKMGYALARVCLQRGAQVTLVSGPCQSSMKEWENVAPLSLIPVVSAAEMYHETISAFKTCDIAILCAAVADFTPVHAAQQKIKKEAGQTSMTLELGCTIDIAATLGSQKSQNQKLIGFALETQNELNNAQRKLESKNLDLIVLNSLQDAGAGFATDTNKVTLLYPNHNTKDLPLMSKEEVANAIISNLD
jgi:phosphopantothenoylcysteine decarboxylase/phosphopantothenate--cysteine ligase